MPHKAAFEDSGEMAVFQQPLEPHLTTKPTIVRRQTK
jgi:hypothetical protein